MATTVDPRALAAQKAKTGTSWYKTASQRSATATKSSGGTSGSPAAPSNSAGTSNDVRELQKALMAAGYDVGYSGADGIMGANTTAAIKAYQRDNGLSVDGIAGTQTKTSLANNGYYNAQQEQEEWENAMLAGQIGTQMPSFDSYLSSSGYEKYKQEVTDAINAQTERAVNAYNKQIEETEENREKMARQAYIAKMQSQRNLDQQLSAAGYAGGMADSQRIRVENDYNNALADIDTQRQNEVDALERAIEDARLNGDSELAGYLAEYQQAASDNYQRYVQQIQAQQYADAKEAAAAAAAAQAASYSSGKGGSYSGGGYNKSVPVSNNVPASSGAASWSDVKRTISGYLSTGQVSKANQLASSVYGQLSQAQRNELAKMGMTIG